MSFFSTLFGGGYQDAAQQEASGLTAAINAEYPFYTQGTADVTNAGAAALAPYTALNTTATQGTNKLADVLGLNGPAGSANALKTLEATPGYQFSLQQGEQAVDRGAAATSGGNVDSGNTMNAEDQFAQGLAQNTYGQYVSSLEPYLGVGENAAAGIAGTNLTTGGLEAALAGNQGNLTYNTNAGIGNAYAAADTAGQNAENSFINGVIGAVGNIGGKLLGGKTPTQTG